MADLQSETFAACKSATKYMIFVHFLKVLLSTVSYSWNLKLSVLQFKNAFLETHSEIILSSGKTHNVSTGRRIETPNCKVNMNDFRNILARKRSFIEAKMILGSEHVPIGVA